MRALRMLVVASVGLGLSCGGCERTSVPPAKDTVTQGVPPQVEPATPAADSLGWEASAGSVLLVADSAAQSAEVIFPELDDSALASTTRFDAARVRNVQLDLFARAGKVGETSIPPTAELKAGGSEQQVSSGGDPDDPDDSADAGGGCAVWPTVRVPAAAPARPAPPGPWTVAFLHGRAEAVSLDSIEGMRRADSARFAAEVARIASAIPNDTAQAFFGLPFEVRSAFRFKAAPGVDAVVATVVRKIGQEANPREQHTLFIAERDSGRSSGPYRLAFVDRVSGSEDVVETREVLAAVTLGTQRATTLVLGRHFYEGWSYSLLERTGPLKWRTRWTSAYAGC